METTTTTTKKVTQAAAEKVHIPVKPALGTAANAVALGAAGVVAGGATAAAVAAAAAVVAAAAVKGGKKAAQARAQRRAFQTRSVAGGGKPSGGGRSGKLGASGTGRSAKATGSGRKPSGSATAGGSGKQARAGGRTGAHRAGAAGGRSGLFRSSGSGRGVSGPRRSGASPSRSLRHRASRVAKSPAARWAGAQLRKAARGVRSGSGRTAALARRARRRSWGWLRRWVQRNIMGRAPEPTPKKNTRPTGPAPLNLKDAFEKGVLINETAPQRTVIRPLNSEGTHAPATHTGGSMLRDMMRQVEQYAIEYDAPGVLEIIHDLGEGQLGLAESVGIFADSFRALADTCQKRWPFDDAIVQKFKMIGECLDTAAQMARGVVPDIETIHEAELRRLRTPGVGQEKFDLSANGYV